MSSSSKGGTYDNEQCAQSALCAVGLMFAGGLAFAGGRYGPGVRDTEITIGNTMPYSGPASSYGTIGKSEAAYFAMINEQGDINGRKIQRSGITKIGQTELKSGCIKSRWRLSKSSLVATIIVLRKTNGDRIQE